MTELEYLRVELISAHTLLAKCEGHLMIDQAERPYASRGACLRDVREFQRHGIHVLPEGVERGV